MLFFVVLAVSLMALASSCKKVCGENLPQYSLSAGQRAWTDLFAATTVWRFRNAAGYERTYRVTKAETQNVGGGSTAKFSVCSTYYEEYSLADLERTDSTLTSFAKGIYHLQVAANIGRNFLQWNHTSFLLPINEVEAGQKTLSPATFGGRTYPSVMECTSQPFTPQVLHLFLTKADGVVAFDDPYGTLWTRI